MPVLEAKERSRVFNEVNHGYDLNRALFEANRCLRCQEPECNKGCPVNIPIPDFIQLISQNKIEEALRLVKKYNSLPGVCGRVCPQEVQCEGKCHFGGRFKPVAIGYLERFIADWEIANGRIKEEVAPPKPCKVAVVGSGPAGLTVAGDLIRKGYKVTIFEALDAPGGVLRYGIPEFRLPKAILDFEVEGLKKLGVEIVCDFIVGRTKSVDEILQEYDALFLGTGAGLPSFMGIEGEHLNGVLSANEFLTRINLMKAYLFPEYDTPVKAGKKTIVVGSGNVAMDSVRSAKRLGAEEAVIVYRRTIKEMTARIEEYEHAIEEGIKFYWLTNPTRIISDDKGWVKAVEVEKMKLGEPDASGRARPVPTGEKYIMEADMVISAIGTSPNPLISKTTPDLKIQKWGGVIVDEATMSTSKDRVYAGGDAVTGAATVILAAGAGRTAANAIDKLLASGKVKRN
ncbi:MAG: NADPH-dependent glutamate synthase [Elusimicrobia bacterium]|nr:NADPH-dependent glutamate synthase [Elusimicrobiota bacterium]